MERSWNMYFTEYRWEKCGTKTLIGETANAYLLKGWIFKRWYLKEWYRFEPLLANKDIQ